MPSAWDPAASQLMRSAWLLTTASVPAMQENGATGGDILELEDDDLTADLGLSRLQVLRSDGFTGRTLILFWTPVHVLQCETLD